MNRYILLFVCCTVATLISPDAHAAAAGSSRPIVQKNFRQLIETNGCPSCDLAGVVLTRVDLSGANLEGANLAGAKLYLANLSGANLKNTNLQGTGLGGADLAGADLRGANLTGAILEGAYLKGARMDGNIITRRPYREEPLAGAGEKVYVEDTAKPKHKPYAQDVVVEPRRDFEEMPPVIRETGKKKPSGMQEAVVSPRKEDATVSDGLPGRQPAGRSGDEAGHAKKLAPIADVVLPAGVTAEQIAATEPRQLVGSGPGAPSDAEGGVMSRSSADNHRKKLPEVRPEKGTFRPEPAHAGTTETDTGGGPETNLQSRTTPQPGPDSRPSEIAPLPQRPAVEGPVYTVETPQAAAVRQQLLVERLLDDKHCAECDLTGVDLSGRWLSGADLERADLQGANLQGVDLSESNLKGADLRGANLRDADLRGADLYTAYLNGADLTGARLQDALVDSAEFAGAIGVHLDKTVSDK